MAKTNPPDEVVEFEVNGIKCGYDEVCVWATNEEGIEEDIGMFEDIKLLEKTSHCAIKKPDDIHEWSCLLSYSKKELYESIENGK